MNIVIPSAGRPGAQRTLEALPVDWLESTYLAVPPTQAKEYEKALEGVPLAGVWPVPGRIADVRQAVLEHFVEEGEPHVAMLDDDLSFHTTRNEEGTRYRKATSREVGQALDWMATMLCDGSVWAGFANRFMANRRPLHYQNAAPSMAWAVDAEALASAGIRANPHGLELCEDWHVALSVLEAGWATDFTSRYVVSGAAQNVNGGCATYRDAGMVAKAQDAFVQLHPDTSFLVDAPGLVQGCKVAKALRCQWKKAYQLGQQQQAGGLSEGAKELLDMIKQCDGAEVHRVDWPLLEELEERGLATAGGARGPGGDWKRGTLA